MKIYTSFQPMSFYNTQRDKKLASSNKYIMSLSSDTVSFGAMKKAQFKGADRICVEKFKAPIEKFNTNEDLQKWAGDRLNKLIKNDYGGRHEETITQRKIQLKEWVEHLTQEKEMYNNSARLLILSSLTKDLRSDNDILLPRLKKEALVDVMSRVKQGNDINILKEYKNVLKNTLFTKNTNDKMTGWIVIPSKKHDAENFENNIEKLKVVSHHNWCTHSFKAEEYLSKGDFHIYLDNGKPKLGLRFIDNGLHEIQGERNNSKIPNMYFDVLQCHIKKYKLTSDAKSQLSRGEKVHKYSNMLKAKLEGKDDYEIFGYLGYLPNSKGSILTQKEGLCDKVRNFLGLKEQNCIQFPKRKSKNITLAFYKQPNDDITFEDIGIDENMLFKNVSKIHGNADFEESNLKSLHGLEYISGDASFSNSDIRDLGNLKRIGGDAEFSDSKVESLGKLENIAGEVWFRDSMLISLGKLKHIGRTAGFSESKIEDLGELESIDGNVYFSESPIKNLKNLRKIGGNADFSQSDVEDLGQLESIGKNAYFENSKIKNLKKLRNIGGHAYIGNSELNHTDFQKVYFCPQSKYEKLKN